ncbi:MAG TPA: hypothetical protein VFA63_15875 [Pseudonocardiaceae bacterium]|nr:hypothetical protein [Pseudonocardiaceae bacterium]
MAAVSATVVCSVAQAADSSDDSGSGRIGTSNGSSGLGSHLQRDGFGRYLSDPEQFYYGSDGAGPSASSAADEDSSSNDNAWDDGPRDTARGGKGGKAGTNSSHCEMTLGPGMKPQQCSGGTAAHDGADGEARYIP